jgi:hypothetical protein
MAKAWSGRMASSRRHKIDRKKREAKRDIRRAAKALKAAGEGGTRKKKAREVAKSALRISKSSARKEAVLTQLLKVREAIKERKSAKRTTTKRKRVDEEEDEEAEEDVEEEEDEEGEEFEEEEVSDSDGGSGDDDGAVEKKVRAQRRLFIPTSQAGNFVQSFTKLVDTVMFPPLDHQDAAIPSAVVVTVDGRCATQSAPWSELDFIVHRSLENPPKNKQLVAIVLCKADLLSAPALAAQYKLLSDAIVDRYKKAGAPRTSNAAGLALPIEFVAVPFSCHIEGTTRQLLKVLHRYSDTIRLDHKDSRRHNLSGKLAAVLLGMPKSGKSTLLKSVCAIAGESAVAVAPLTKLMTLDEDGSGQERLIVPSPKSVTFLTLHDQHPEAVNKNSIIGGDAVFASDAIIDKMPTPEAAAIVLLSQLTADSLGEVAQNFSLTFESDSALSSEEEKSAAATRILKALGRTIIRERGFLPSAYLGVGAEPGTGRLGETGDLNASSVKDAAFITVSGRRIVRVWPQKTDGRNALRVGARTLLHEFSSSKHFPWAIIEGATRPLNQYDHFCIFTTKFHGTDAGVETKPKTAAESFLPGLQAMQKAMTAYMALLPKHVVPISPNAVPPLITKFEN